MRIEKLEYEDKELAWKLEPIHFSNLTLLVGVSSVGKTQILQAILNLKKIAAGASLNGLKWDITFIDDHIPNSIADIDSVGKFHYFAICLDAEEFTIQERITEIEDFLREADLELSSIQLILIIQNRCLETWFLGNRKIYKENPQDHTLIDYTRYYNVAVDDPELMGKYDFKTHAHFHKAYLRAIFRERNISYSKRRPGHVLDARYLDQLLVRVTDEPGHLLTFQHFIEFCRMLKPKL